MAALAHLAKHSVQCVRLALHRRGQRVAAQGAEPDAAHLRHLAGLQRQAIIIGHDQRPLAHHDRTVGREIQRRNGQAFALDVIPGVDFRPIGQGEGAQ